MSTATSQEQVVLSIIPRITGTLSILGSGAIIYRILRGDGCEERRRKVYHRLLLCMSCCDIFASFAFALSSWPVPRGYPGAHGARGTVQTCTAQGFMVQMFGLCVPLHNACLGLYYLLVIKYGWKEETLRRAAAPCMYAIPPLVGLATAVACLPLLQFNPEPTAVFCWISPLPMDCRPSFQSGDGETTNCIRGDNAAIYGFAFFIVPVWICIVIATASMAAVFQSVQRQERAVARYRYNGSGDGQDDGGNKSMTKQVARQALLYLVAFWTTWLPPTIISVLTSVGGYDSAYVFILAIVQLTLIPLQGFLNALVYFRPGRAWRRHRENHPGEKIGAALIARFTPSRLKGSSTTAADDSVQAA